MEAIVSILLFSIPIGIFILGAWICKKQSYHEKKMKERDKKIDSIIEEHEKK